MNESLEEIESSIDSIEKYLEKYKPREDPKLIALTNICNSLESAWSGSWIGYHANVYYEGLVSPPPGAHFSSEWGRDEMLGMGTTGRWGEYDPQDVTVEIYARAGVDNLDSSERRYNEGLNLFNNIKNKAEVWLRLNIRNNPDENYFQTLLDKLEKINPLDESTITKFMAPKNYSSRDSLAISQGIKVAPHKRILAKCMYLMGDEIILKSLHEVLLKYYSYSKGLEKKVMKSSTVGTNVFIGHGRSYVWRDLKDLIVDRLRLPYDEFNRVPVAGITNITRLSEMLDSAAIAFIVMTAEDEQLDGTMEARTNVIHEVGLFQGRLGFTKAIVLLEEGCNEFTNINGLGQIRFPKGNISAKFEEIRQVLEREGLV